MSDEVDYISQLESECEAKDYIINGLKEQIEKMKCCAKCSHCNTYITTCILQKRFVRLEDVCENFELRR